MKSGLALGFGAVVAIAWGAISFYYYWHHPKPLTGAKPFTQRVSPKHLAELRFEDANGKSRSLADFRGKLVLLNIWATWCVPCRKEMPALDRLQSALGGSDFEVLALSIDQQGVSQVRKFYSENKIVSLRIYIDSSAQAGFTLGAPGIPTTLLVDSAGREIGRHIGATNWDAPDIVADLRRRMTDGSVQ